MLRQKERDLIDRLNRIVEGADVRQLDETECRAMREAADMIASLVNKIGDLEKMNALYRQALNKFDQR